MTTTPSVADVLGGPTTGAPGVFPDQINLAFNEHVRHHLVHFPDTPSVRWDDVRLGSLLHAPAGRSHIFSATELESPGPRVEPDRAGRAVAAAVDVDEPLRGSAPVPNDLSMEPQHTFIDVTDDNGVTHKVPCT